MDQNKGTEKKDDKVIPPVEPVKTAETEDNAEARVAALEAEKAAILEREANYKAAYLKEKSKHSDPDAPETDDERFRRIAREEMANTRLSQIDTERETLYQKALKENKELKLAQLNKGNPAASVGAHSESQAVSDTLVTSEQLATFKKMGKTDKWIENYKRNLQRNSR